VDKSERRSSGPFHIQRTRGVHGLEHRQMALGRSEVVARSQPTVMPLKGCIELHAVAGRHRSFQLAKRESKVIQRKLERGGSEVAGGKRQERRVAENVRELECPALIAHADLSTATDVEPQVESAGELAQLIACHQVFTTIKIERGRSGRGLRRDEKAAKGADRPVVFAGEAVTRAQQ